MESDMILRRLTYLTPSLIFFVQTVFSHQIFIYIIVFIEPLHARRVHFKIVIVIVNIHICNLI